MTQDFVSENDGLFEKRDDASRRHEVVVQNIQQGELGGKCFIDILSNVSQRQMGTDPRKVDIKRKQTLWHEKLTVSLAYTYGY